VINAPLGSPKVPPESLLFVLDSGAFSHGANLPPSQCRTTPSVVAEFQPGGATRRRLDLFLAAGLVVEAPPAEPLARVREAAARAGSTSRLSAADADVIALALATGGRLVTDDYTVQDVARRLGVHVESVATKGVEANLDWGGRCAGCGRRYDAVKIGSVCPICGAQIVGKPRRR
jgi:endoribonuclease Nob1